MNHGLVHTPFMECREPSVIEPLRQGDVLESTDPSAPMWTRNLVVITADCDLAHDKHKGRITCVPLLTSAEYLLEFQIPNIRDRFIRKKVLMLQQLLERQGGPRISSTRLIRWVAEEDVPSIIESLELEGKNVEAATAALDAIQLVGSKSENLSSALATLVDAHVVGDRTLKRTNVIKDITGRIKGCYSQTPGDALFLSSISLHHQDGYFAYLRHLELVGESEIATAPTRSSVQYRRISRLTDRFRFALVQRFALVYMSIGLPSEYEDVRELHSEIAGDLVR